MPFKLFRAVMAWNWEDEDEEYYDYDEIREEVNQWKQSS